MDSSGTTDASECEQPLSKPYLVPVVFDREPSSKDEKHFACIIADSDRPKLAEALQSLGREVCYSADGRSLPDSVPDDCDMVFVCEEFEGETYDYLHARKLRILGPPCVLSCAQNKKELPNTVRPMYSCTMQGVVVCFTGFKDKQSLHDLCTLIHLMGASIRKDINSHVTHVVAHSVSGSKYKVAVGLCTAIMSEEWITASWARRDDPTVSAASDPALLALKQLPFTGCVISLHGFSQEDAAEMRQIATDNGAVNAEFGSSSITHLVVSNEVEAGEIPYAPSRVSLVKQQWFWESIQIEACADEQLYQAKEQHGRRPRSKHSFNASLLSVDMSLLEASLFSLASPASSKSQAKRDGVGGGGGGGKGGKGASPRTSGTGGGAGPEDTARRHIASELLQTEKNFVDILTIIVKLFKEPLESPEQRGGPVLPHEHSKSIFGNVAEILSVHTRLVASLREELGQWSQKTCIGKVLLEQSEDFLRVYPPFVNYFDMSKEALGKCERLYPRFHAFLKANESRPECSRQKLGELLITPVQRIPRILLLLQDLVKHTDKEHPDLATLQRAVESLKTVMNHINEDRRKTEGQMHMFEVLRDVEGCPATVLSSHRSFLSRFDVVDISSSSSSSSSSKPTAKGGGETLSVFLFSDSMEIARKRPSSNFALKSSSSKQLKHLEFLPFTNVRAVVHFGDSGEFSQAFGVLVRWPEDPQEKLLVFRLVAEEPTRADVVSQIARLIASTNFATDSEQFIVCSSSEMLNSMGKSPVSSTSLRKALRGARKRVRRAFSGRQRKSLSSMSVHQNLAGIGEENETPPTLDLSAQTDPVTSPNASMCSTSALTFTPVSGLRTPRAKRPALGQLPSFSVSDLSHITSTDV